MSQIDQYFDTPDNPLPQHITPATPPTRHNHRFLFLIPGAVFFILIALFLLLSLKRSPSPSPQISVEPTVTLQEKNTTTLALEQIIASLESFNITSPDPAVPNLDLEVKFP